LSKEVEDLTAELEEVSAGFKTEKEELIDSYDKEIADLKVKLETENTDHTFLKRQFETLEEQYKALLKEGPKGGGGGLFGDDAEKLNSARADLLKANKMVHQYEQEKSKLQADVVEMQKEIDKAVLERGEALSEVTQIDTETPKPNPNIIVGR